MEKIIRGKSENYFTYKHKIIKLVKEIEKGNKKYWDIITKDLK